MLYSIFNLSKMKIVPKITGSLLIGLISLISYSPAFTQSSQLIIGGGIAPIHQSIQSDFSALNMPYDIHLQYQLGPFGIRADYSWNATYQKENFSFTTTTTELSLVYVDQKLLRPLNMLTYARVGISRWQTRFSTEGYPGITDYTLKVEEDSGFGPVGAIGILFPIKNLRLGIEGQYIRNSQAQFIAGGFDPQPLETGQVRLMVTAQYRLPITFSSPKGFSVLCPKF